MGRRLRIHYLDSSALLAAVMGEPGADQVLEIIDRSAISAVNLLEVFGKIQKGIPAERVRERLDRAQAVTTDREWTKLLPKHRILLIR